MDCADCALKIEKGVGRLDGIETVQVDFTSGLLRVEGAAGAEQIRRRVESLGYTLEEKASQGATHAQPNGFWQFLLSRPETRLALAGGAILLISVLAGWAGAPAAAVNAAQVVALLVAGYPVARGALANLWINRAFSIDLLMTIAALGAVIIGEITESATLIFLFTISEALEGYAADRARRILSDMSSLAPAQALRITAGGEELVPVERLAVGDEIVVYAGERIPMDGRIVSGSSAVDQAPVTGESIPVEKAPGDAVFAGTVNGGGVLAIRVTHLAQDTTIQRIIHMIEQAQSLRAPTQRFIDRFASVYTPIMMAAAVLIAALPPLLFGEPFFNPPGGTGWLYRALALLVIACPCALVISAPVTIVSAITAAARRGVLFKGGVHLEALTGIRVFAFDKTGTLTRGQPVVTDFRSIDCLDDARHRQESPLPAGACESCGDVLAMASALERRSLHPLARSVVAAAEAAGLDSRYRPAEAVTALPGSGLQGQVNGKLATIGSHKLFDSQHPHHQALCSWVEAAEGRGQTTMLVCDGDHVLGYIAAADTIRPESRQALAELKQMGKTTVMLTGDNAAAAGAIAGELGIDHVRSGLLPDEKVAAVRGLDRMYGRVAMVGDGINDAPALASAGLGIAIGGASSAQAMETADVVMMAGDLRQLPFAIRLSGFTRRLIRQNVAISLATKLAFVLLALGGLTTLWLAVLADVGVSLVVTLNGLRANRYK
jgi:Cd2+/Zn2+-exporting ATPase